MGDNNNFFSKNLGAIIGIVIGIILSSILTNYLLKNHNQIAMSFILGLVLMSGIAIIPQSGYNIHIVITSILSFILGGVIVIGTQKLEK